MIINFMHPRAYNYINYILFSIITMRLTPAMQQYMDVKSENPDAIVLFRMGDFYEKFYDDALLVSEILNITLTSRGKGESKANLAGFPYHALDKFIGKLVKSGHKVAICEQIEDPKKAKGIVKRAVTRVITPGTVIEDFILDDNMNNYIAALFNDGDSYGLAVSDLSTGEFQVGEVVGKDIMISELARFSPAEIVIPKGMDIKELKLFFDKYNIYQAVVPTHNFFYKIAKEQLEKKFGSINLHDKELAVCAAGALLSYLSDNQKGDLGSITHLTSFEQTDYMGLNPSTLRNLEIVKNIRDQTSKDTLLDVLDLTQTAMGGRLLRNWLLRPLLDIEKIQRRHGAVETLITNSLLLQDTSEVLSTIRDVERLTAKISYRTVNARDIRNLYETLELLPKINKLLDGTSDVLLKTLSKLPDFIKIKERIVNTLVTEPPLTVREGGMICKGVNEELDELHSIRRDTKQFMAALEKKESDETGISSLKIKYNRVFGYFLEVSNRFKDKVPEHYIRKQTLSTGERFITEDLKNYESKLLGAEEKIKNIEYDIFMKLVDELQELVEEFQDSAIKIAKIDVLCSFATVAKKSRYVKPEMSKDFEMHLVECRHPVVERIEEAFIPNDCILKKDSRFMILTGPNMAGKSTFMRQIALSALMAQIGSFVPASTAKLCIVDKIFTRVGAHDDLTQGQSTFMVEMSEAADILHNATDRSLIILDEIGRGTSTYDGTALAWAVAEDIITRIGAKSLFATHYHVLSKLSKHNGAFNMNVAVEEEKDHITFLHKIIEGGTDKSYGVHVAKLAGLPTHVIDAARNIQFQLEDEDKMHEKITVEKIEEKEDKVVLSKLKQSNLEEF